MSYGITQLLSDLATSSSVTMVLNDFRREQFVLVNGDLKLTDLDDVGFREPICDTAQDCRNRFTNYTR